MGGAIEPFVEIQSASRVVLEDLKHMSQTCGVNTVVKDYYPNETEDIFIVGTWTITFAQLRFLRDRNLLTKFHTFEWEELPLSPDEMSSLDMHPNVRVLEILSETLIDDSYCFTEPKKHACIFNGIRTACWAAAAIHFKLRVLVITSRDDNGDNWILEWLPDEKERKEVDTLIVANHDMLHFFPASVNNLFVAHSSGTPSAASSSAASFTTPQEESKY